MERRDCLIRRPGVPLEREEVDHMFRKDFLIAKGRWRCTVGLLVWKKTDFVEGGSVPHKILCQGIYGARSLGRTFLASG